MKFTRILVMSAVMVLCGACSKSTDNSGPPLTDAQILVQSGEWFTSGATLVASDGTQLKLAGNDPFLRTILLYNVTFYVNGTATDTNDPNGLTQNGLTWQLSGTHLLVHINGNNTDKVDAMITYLSQYKLVMEVTDFYYYNGVTYVKLIQTLSH